MSSATVTLTTSARFRLYFFCNSDIDFSESLDEQEMLDMMIAVFSSLLEKDSAAHAKAFVNVAFAHMDDNGDGVLSYREFEKVAFMQPLIFKFFHLDDTPAARRASFRRSSSHDSSGSLVNRFASTSAGSGVSLPSVSLATSSGLEVHVLHSSLLTHPYVVTMSKEGAEGGDLNEDWQKFLIDQSSVHNQCDELRAEVVRLQGLLDKSFQTPIDFFF